jgi:hypothetical protein
MNLAAQVLQLLYYLAAAESPELEKTLEKLLFY